MNREGRDGFWTNMVFQRPLMETNRARSPAEDRTQVVLPAPNACVSDGLLEGKKAGAALLFSGVALALMGATLTAMGWQHYKTDPYFEWVQLLGPVLISVGGTFVLTSVCKFPIMSCCKRGHEEALMRPVIEQTSTLSCISHPVLLHSPTTVVCLPPPYSFVTRDVQQAVCGVDNAAFTAAEEDGSAHSREADHRRRRVEKTEDERGHGPEDGSRPPAYEDIFPSFNKHNQT
uniref:uncharacterized protein tmem174 n=1 Tax=Semicossyphus pulcher TaxID=241346 RepID=UPI0037E7C076